MTYDEALVHYGGDPSLGGHQPAAWDARNKPVYHPVNPNIPQYTGEGDATDYEYTMNPHGNPVWTKKSKKSHYGSNPALSGIVSGGGMRGSPRPTAPGAASVYDQWGQGPAAFQAQTFDPSGYGQARADRQTGYQAYLKKMREAEGLVSTGRGQSLADVAEYYDDLGRSQEAAAVNAGFTPLGGGGSPDKRLAEMRRATSGYDRNLAAILSQQAQAGMQHGAGLSDLERRKAEAGQQYGLAQQKFGLESRSQDIGREAGLAGLAQQQYAAELQAWLSKMGLDQKKQRSKYEGRRA